MILLYLQIILSSEEDSDETASAKDSLISTSPSDEKDTESMHESCLSDSSEIDWCWVFGADYINTDESTSEVEESSDKLTEWCTCDINLTQKQANENNAIEENINIYEVQKPQETPMINDDQIRQKRHEKIVCMIIEKLQVIITQLYDDDQKRKIEDDKENVYKFLVACLEKIIEDEDLKKASLHNTELKFRHQALFDVIKVLYYKHVGDVKKIMNKIENFCSRNEKTGYNFYDYVIKKTNQVPFFVKNYPKTIDFKAIKYHAYRWIFLSLIDECKNNDEIFNTICLQTNIVKQNIKGCFAFDNKYSKFIFEEALYNYVNYIKVNSDNKIDNSYSFKFKIYDSIISFIHDFCKEEIELLIKGQTNNINLNITFNSEEEYKIARTTYENIQKHYDEKKENFGIIMKKLSDKLFLYDSNILNKKISIDREEAGVLSIIMHYNIEFKDVFCLEEIPYSFNEYMSNIAEFIGIKYDKSHGICSISKQFMYKPVYYNDNDKENFDLYTILCDYIQTKSLNENVDKSNIFSFENSTSNIVISDIRNYKLNHRLESITNSFAQGMGGFEKYTRCYISKSFYDTLPKESDFLNIVSCIIQSKFTNHTRFTYDRIMTNYTTMRENYAKDMINLSDLSHYNGASRKRMKMNEKEEGNNASEIQKNKQTYVNYVKRRMFIADMDEIRREML